MHTQYFEKIFENIFCKRAHTILVRFPYGFSMFFHGLSIRFPMAFMWISTFSYSFPLVFLLFFI